jgi:cytochrome P450
MIYIMLTAMRPLVIQHDPVARQPNKVPTLLPYHFDVTRTNVDHVTFGKGSPHLCLGSALARMKIRLMFIELIPRLVSIELNGEVTRVRSNFVNGIKKFPVRVHPPTPEVEY